MFFKIFFIILLIILDFFSKKLVFNSIGLNSFIYVTSFFDLAHIHNYGISFGLFSGLMSHWLLVIIGLLVIIFLISIYFKARNNLEKWGILVIIAGGLSNIFDRSINGYVIDFLYFHYNDFYWPAFNFADIYISIGILIILYQILKDFNKRNKDT